MGELFGGENAEHIGLVFGPRCRAVKFPIARLIGADIRVVAGDNGVKAER